MATRTVTQNAVSGTHRFKYFKRPIMPKINAVPPEILLAPTAAENPLISLRAPVEEMTKDAEVQTMYRDSEAQTAPYTPNYVVADGENPEVLLLKSLTYANGLPLGKKEIEMIEYARAKREMEINLPPFTDEASLALRKKLMEQQEMREFRLREAEIDIRRENKLMELKEAMTEREESAEFMVSQRLESARLLRMEEREKVLQKIRNKRIKALRRIAHQRNSADPILSGGTQRDIINDYFDKGSSVYAPVQREGQETVQNAHRYDVSSRTVPLDSIGNILSLEYTIPRRYLDSGAKDDNDMAPTHLSKTAPPGSMARSLGGGGRAAEMRLTSAAARSIRNTKRDVEEMHHILNARKHATLQIIPRTIGSGRGGTGGSRHEVATPVSPSKKVKGRPVTPDFTLNREIIDLNSDDNQQQQQAFIPPEHLNDEFQSAVILLQRLIRGRAVQNIMFEGKYRRGELIDELKAADESKAFHHETEMVKIDLELQIAREAALRSSTLDSVIGGGASQLLHIYSQEKSREVAFAQMQISAASAIEERRNLEAVEAGRRQKV